MFEPKQPILERYGLESTRITGETKKWRHAALQLH